MIFEISRTSDWQGDRIGVEGVRKIKVHTIDRRTVPTLKEAETHFWYKHWFESTINHREENGLIAGDNIKETEINVIDIEPEKIVEFAKSVGYDIIISVLEDEYVEKIDGSIEIYDGYRE